MRILLLGSTGSIGKSVCSCVRRFTERFSITGLSVNKNINSLQNQIDEFNPKAVCISNESFAKQVAASIPSSIRLYIGEKGLLDITNELEYDVLVNAIVGAAGFKPTVAALKRKKRVALANKESLVIGGEYIRGLLKQGFGELVPIDSEHSAIMQCLIGEEPDTVESIILTASGGPFLDVPLEHFDSIKPELALKHPTWNMGDKITIDAATLMNKGFEIIEAHHLFSMPFEKLRVWIHPQSIVHSFVEFHDGALIAQLGLPSMELPIQFALSYPKRLSLPGARLNLPSLRSLTFFEPDFRRFPCLKLCIEVGKEGGTAPVVLNAANEIAVNLFLNNKISFTHIPELIHRALDGHNNKRALSPEIIDDVDRQTRHHLLNIYK